MPDAPLDLPVTFVTLVVLYIMVPILVVVHELGHAAAVVRAGKRPTVMVGKSPPLIAYRFRSFDLRFHPRLALEYFYPRTALKGFPKTYVGYCHFDPTGLTVGQLRAIYSSGPHASMLAGLCFAAVAWFIPASSLLFWIAAFTAVWAAIDGIGNLVPAQHEGASLFRRSADDMASRT